MILCDYLLSGARFCNVMLLASPGAVRHSGPPVPFVTLVPRSFMLIQVIHDNSYQLMPIRANSC